MYKQKEMKRQHAAIFIAPLFSKKKRKWKNKQMNANEVEKKKQMF